MCTYNTPAYSYSSPAGSPSVLTSSSQVQRCAYWVTSHGSWHDSCERRVTAFLVGTPTNPCTFGTCENTAGTWCSQSTLSANEGTTSEPCTCIASSPQSECMRFVGSISGLSRGGRLRLKAAHQYRVVQLRALCDSLTIRRVDLSTCCIFS